MFIHCWLKKGFPQKQKVQYVTKIAATKEERIELINNNWELVDKDGED
jgi:hypothetical protein